MTDLLVSSVVNINSLVWISSLATDEKGTTRRVHDDLEPYFHSIGLPFESFEPSSASEFLAYLHDIEERARNGWRPIIHLDTHGSKEEGVSISSSGEHVSWPQLVRCLRPINIATGNNLCVISAACFSLHAIKEVKIEDPAPFFALIAPQLKVSFGFVEERTVPFYRAVFDQFDIFAAHQEHLASDFEAFLCEKMLLVGLTKYIRDHCLGEGRRNRVDDLLSKAVADGLPNNRANRRVARSVAKKMTKPDQELIDRFVQKFLIGKRPDVTIQQLIEFAQRTH